MKTVLKKNVEVFSVSCSLRVHRDVMSRPNRGVHVNRSGAVSIPAPAPRRPPGLSPSAVVYDPRKVVDSDTSVFDAFMDEPPPRELDENAQVDRLVSLWAERSMQRKGRWRAMSRTAERHRAYDVGAVLTHGRVPQRGSSMTSPSGSVDSIHARKWVSSTQITKQRRRRETESTVFRNTHEFDKQLCSYKRSGPPYVPANSAIRIEDAPFEAQEDQQLAPLLKGVHIDRHGEVTYELTDERTAGETVFNPYEQRNREMVNTKEAIRYFHVLLLSMQCLLTPYFLTRTHLLTDSLT